MTREELERQIRRRAAFTFARASGPGGQNVNKVSSKAVARLRLRKRFLEKVENWLNDNLKAEDAFPSHQILLLKHHRNLLNAEEGFVDEIINIVKNQ